MLPAALTTAVLCLASATTARVGASDTLTRLAVRHSTTVAALIQANPGLQPDRPRAGQGVRRSASICVQTVLPVQGRLTTPASALHTGLDLTTPIRAALAGTVRELRFDAWYGRGWTVVINHGNGSFTRCNRNSANLVREGQQVTAGQVIAWVGSTGDRSGPQVDFRLYQAGVQVDHSRLF